MVQKVIVCSDCDLALSSPELVGLHYRLCSSQTSLMVRLMTEGLRWGPVRDLPGTGPKCHQWELVLASWNRILQLLD